jgi:hypothetical protein
MIILGARVTNPHLEVWNSSEMRQEKHYFLKDGKSHAYQNADYLFGINPLLVTPELEGKILELLKPVYEKGLSDGREI